MKFQVLGEREIKDLDQKRKHVVISIRSPKANKAQIPDNSNCLNILYLEFHDLDGLHMPSPALSYVRLFTSEHAKQILNFVNRYKDMVDVIICQCEAGISRSAGVAGALSKIINGNDFYFFNYYLPNMLVYRTILEEYNFNENI